MKAALGAAMLLLAAIAAAPAVAGEPLSVFAQSRWSELPQDVKERALENYRVYQNLTPEERGKVENEYRRWQEMSAEDKKEYRDRHRRYQSLSREERERLRAKKR